MKVTIRHFVNTYLEDIKWGWNRGFTEESFLEQQSLDTRGIFTVEYPEVKLAKPERFRFIPFLVTEPKDHEDDARKGKQWCTACGICAKVCPPQCIWIVRCKDPDTGKPMTEPEQFYIDIDVCMNCGLCAEYCPFDSIKMDHHYELASYDRTTAHIFDIKKLSKEFSYWQEIAPNRAAAEAEARGGWEHKDVLKERERAARSAAKAADSDDDGGEAKGGRAARGQRGARGARGKAQAEAPETPSGDE
ncbi:MAG: 4Fe-4S binding protein [Anaerolineae bacterium]|nr:4Fe-4S binding protein [Anaerolineae bacterium]